MAEQTNNNEQRKAELLEQVANGDISTGTKATNIAAGVGIGAVTGVGTYFGGKSFAESQLKGLPNKVIDKFKPVAESAGEHAQTLGEIFAENISEAGLTDSAKEKIANILEPLNNLELVQDAEKRSETLKGILDNVKNKIKNKFGDTNEFGAKLETALKDSVSTIKNFIRGNVALAIGVVAIPTAIAVGTAAYFNKKSRDKVREGAKEELTQVLNAESATSQKANVELMAQLQQTEQKLEHSNKQLAAVHTASATVHPTTTHPETHHVDGTHHDAANKSATHFQDLAGGPKPEHTTHVDAVGGEKPAIHSHVEHAKQHHEHGTAANALG